MCETNTVIKKNSTKKPFGYIYLATNTHNGKVYVGKTTQIVRQRWNDHLKEGRALRRLRAENPCEKVWGSHLNNAIVKYGELIWTIEILDQANSEDELNELEMFWISEYDSTNRKRGYNMTSGGDGFKLVGEARISIGNKISEMMIGKWKKHDYREMMTEILTEVNRKKAKDLEFLKKLRASRIPLRKEIPDIKIFLEEIKSGETGAALGVKYKMSPSSINNRIKEILGKYGAKSIRVAKKFLRDKIIELQEDGDLKFSKDPNFKKYSKQDMMNFKKIMNSIKLGKMNKELEFEFHVSRTTINRRIEKILGEYGVKNYTEAKKFLHHKKIDEFLGRSE